MTNGGDSMFNSSVIVDLAEYSVVVVVAIAAIGVILFRAFHRKDEKPWPVFFVGLYNIVLLLLFLLGAMTQINLEGWGFLPLIGLTLPWSLCMGILAPLIDHVLGVGANFRFPGSSFEATLLIHFIFFNVLCGSVNSCILYALLRRR
jgi:hypothetical protein